MEKIQRPLWRGFLLRGAELHFESRKRGEGLGNEMFLKIRHIK